MHLHRFHILSAGLSHGNLIKYSALVKVNKQIVSHMSKYACGQLHKNIYTLLSIIYCFVEVFTSVFL